MPRRKKNVSAEPEEVPAPKKSKNSTSDLDGVETCWEWEGDGNKWTKYASDFNEDITSSYDLGEKEAILDVGAGVQMRIIFSKMVQKNKMTGWERRIRCCLKQAAETDYFTWVWEDEHGHWNPYDVSTALKLEKAQQDAEDSLNVAACGRAYTISLSSMEQTNDATKVIRKIQRQKTVGAVPAPAATPSTSKSKAAANGAAKGSVGAKKGSTGRRGRSSKDVDEDEAAEEDEKPNKSTMKTVVVKGKAPVDPECTTKVKTAHVFSEGKDIYDAMLNQTNVGNNNNKYYLMQLLQDDNRKSYSVWFRWGRVGYSGQTALVPCGPNLDQAKQVFGKKFSDKTKNDFAMRSKFQKTPGKYDLVQVDYNATDAKDEPDGPEAKPKKPVKVPDSKLDKRLQDLINLICDIKAMEETVMEMKYDAKKAPLGKLTTAQIKAGYAALKVIDSCITANTFGAKLVEACNDFYTRIPHNFGFQVPPLIKTKVVLKAKMDLLEALGDIEIAMKILKRSVSTENPMDTHYSMLKCELTSMDHSDEDFKLVDAYLQNTHATTHNQYKMKILEMFDVEKQGDTGKFVDHGNRMLLWHGSRLTNWMGILSQGLRIAPPEAPVTGYMFGKGVYFADMSSKSANYCYPTRAKNVGLVLLCEVSLGKCNELLAADMNAGKLPSGTHSVFAKGKVAPDPAKNHTMSNGTIIPLGKGADTGVANPHGYTLNYNEFIVYDLNQIRMKYLLKVQFNFK